MSDVRTVSVVVPLYNKKQTVARMLRSITNQTWQDLEVIVVDDGSTDGSAAIARQHPDPRLRVVQQPNAGPGAARNSGAELATGEFLAFLDADDEWEPNFVAETMEMFERNPDIAMATSGYRVYPSGDSAEGLWQRRGLREGRIRISPETALRDLFWLLIFITPCATILRRQTFRRLGGFYGSDRAVYGEDAHLWLKVLFTESIAIETTPRVALHADASDLSRSRVGPRPVEAFLTAPHEITEVCPPELRSLLRRLMAVRAFRTACVLGYWGDWRKAARLVKQYYRSGDWKLPYFAPAALFATPLGPVAGQVWRRFRPTPHFASS